MKKLFSLILAMLLLSVSYVPTVASAATVNVPVLAYHVVTQYPASGNPYQYSLTEFKNEMAYLKNNGYTPLSIDEYYNIINNTATAPSKPILLTFDDCTSDFYSNVYPVLYQYGFKATQFAVSDWINTGGHMTSGQIQEVAANKIDVQNHTSSHVNLTSQTHDQKWSAINNCSTKLKSLIYYKTPAFCAYPYGSYDSDTASILQGLGYKGGFTVSGGLSSSSNNKFALPRIIMTNGDSLSIFIRKITTGY